MQISESRVAKRCEKKKGKRNVKDDGNLIGGVNILLAIQPYTGSEIRNGKQPELR